MYWNPASTSLLTSPPFFLHYYAAPPPKLWNKMLPQCGHSELALHDTGSPVGAGQPNISSRVYLNDSNRLYKALSTAQS